MERSWRPWEGYDLVILSLYMISSGIPVKSYYWCNCHLEIEICSHIKKYKNANEKIIIIDLALITLWDINPFFPLHPFSSYRSYGTLPRPPLIIDCSHPKLKTFHLEIKKFF